jgi:hypothetical protein
MTLLARTAGPVKRETQSRKVGYGVISDLSSLITYIVSHFSFSIALNQNQ